jgi:hypothetical protein
MPFVKFQTSPKSSGNSGSVAPAISYFSKEDKNRDPEEIGYGFFSSEKTGITPEEAKELIEHKLYSKSLGKDESKYFHVMIGFSQSELEGKTDKELIEFVQRNFAETYLEAGKRSETDPSQLVWCAKLETTRKYKGDDEKVRQNAKKSGQLKEGDQRHIHIVVARKTLGNAKISPLSNHFRVGKSKGAVGKGFDQDDFKARIEEAFDTQLIHSRSREDSVITKLAVYRPDLIETNSFDGAIISHLERNIKKLSNLISPKAKKVRTFISKVSTEFMKYFRQEVKRRYQFTDKKHEQLRPHLAKPTIIDHPIPSLKPFESNKSEPFNFLAELEKIKEKEKEITLKMGSMSTEEITKEMMNIHELRKQLMDKNKEEQQRGRLNQSQKKSNPNQDQDFKL